MQIRTRIKTFNDRYPFIGPTMWILSVQYYLTQIVVTTSWTTHYSLTQNTISDLGNTACGSYAGRLVCSPLHGLMNLSFASLGIFMAIGSALIYREFKETTSARLGFSFMAVAGFGTLLVGLFPENTINALHSFGAFLPFFVGNLGIVILGLSLAVPRPLRIYSLITGIFSLVALVLFITGTYLGLGIGGTERLTAYPQTVWLIVFGLYISRNHSVRQQKGAF